MMSPEEDKEFKAQLDQYLADGYIEHARSAYGLVLYLPERKMETYAFVLITEP